MLLNAPAPGVVAEVGDDELRRFIATAGQSTRDPDARVAESDNVEPTVACRVGQEPWMPLDAPPAGVVAEVVDYARDRAEAAVRLGERHIHPGVAESDDVGAAIAGDVDDEARVLVDAPAAGVVAEVVDYARDRAEAAVRLGRET